MSGLLTTLLSSAQALGAHSRAIETAGRNISNVNNPNYARQRVEYGDRGSVQTPYGAQSLGLEALSIQQMRDSLLDRQVMREIGLKSSFESEQKGYQRAQASLAQSIDRSQAAGATNGTGISEALDNFFTAFQSFAARPTDSGERQLLFQKAGILTDRLQATDQRLAQVQTDLNTGIAGDVTDINRLLSTIADLNSQIGRLELNHPGAAVDLRDQREARLEELAAKLPVDVIENATGQMQVFAKDGSGGNVILVDQATVTGPVTFTGTGLTAGSPATALALPSGSIAGALTARDGAVQTLRDNLDQLASQLVTSVNAAYNPTSATGDFFDAAGVTALTIKLDPGLTVANLKASDGGPAGDNTIALAVAQLASKKFSVTGGDDIDGTFSGFFADSVSRIGQALAGANARVDDQGNIEKLVRGQRDSVSGVSLDEEMADLMRYQRAFQASSRVFTVVDDLLDLVVNRLGHP
jgi:flagellar hook-associated protein 1 FlgK